MKKLISCLLLLLVTDSVFCAEETQDDVENKEKKEKKLYKWRDKQGNLHYSDQPQKGAEEIKMKLAPSTKIHQPKPKQILMPQNKKEALLPYISVSLSAPLDNGVVRNNTETVTLTANIQPALQEGHQVRFFVDGALVKSDPGALSVEAKGVKLGKHTANFIIVNATGKQIESSKTISFQRLNRINPAIRKKQQAGGGQSIN